MRLQFLLHKSVNTSTVYRQAIMLYFIIFRDLKQIKISTLAANV